jgi:hypothetical protein
MSTLNCQTSAPRSVHSRPKLPHNLTSQAVQRIPSSIRLRRTQSTPRVATTDYANPTAEHNSRRRHSSNPSIGSPLRYPFEMPQMLGASVTPSNNQRGWDASTSIRMCGRGDLITAEKDPDESPTYASPQPTKHDGNTLPLPAQRLSTISPLGISPTNTSNVAPNNYFASVHSATHIHDEKDHDINDAEDLKGEREDAGPSIDECPILQEIFAKMDASEGEYSSDEYSSDDYSTGNRLRRGLKHESILIEAGSMEEQIVGMFGSRRESE